MATSTQSGVWDDLRGLSGKLASLTAAHNPHACVNNRILHEADVIISHVEVCDRHGVGKLLQMMFLGEPNIISIRSANLYGGQDELGEVALCISHSDTSRDAVFKRVLDHVAEHTVRRVLCVNSNTKKEPLGLL